MSRVSPGVRALIQFALPAIAACSSSTTSPNLGPPAATGTIRSRDPQLGYLIDRSPGTTGPAQLYFALSPQTEFITDGRVGGSADDLSLGKMVAVWPVGAVPDSTPARVTARYVMIYP